MLNIKNLINISHYYNLNIRYQYYYNMLHMKSCSLCINYYLNINCLNKLNNLCLHINMFSNQNHMANIKFHLNQNIRKFLVNYKQIHIIHFANINQANIEYKFQYFCKSNNQNHIKYIYHHCSTNHLDKFKYMFDYIKQVNYCNLYNR